jgi:hypothetical protein
MTEAAAMPWASFAGLRVRAWSAVLVLFMFIRYLLLIFCLKPSSQAGRGGLDLVPWLSFFLAESFVFFLLPFFT